ncbi:Hsp70 protein-domain-containing protein [Lentinula novae-zelandiae]|nr:Hsp70 protein-domain-containing protein [Lentinula novae-zelandiae]
MTFPSPSPFSAFSPPSLPPLQPPAMPPRQTNKSYYAHGSLPTEIFPEYFFRVDEYALWSAFPGAEFVLGSQLLQSSLDRFYRGPEVSPIVSPIHHAIDDSGLNLDEIEVVELIGGSSRIPAVRARIAECFSGKTLSTTLNQDKAVARGATFSCAMLSPVFRVREFSVSGINAYPIKVQWAPVPSDPEEDTELVVFYEAVVYGRLILM